MNRRYLMTFFCTVYVYLHKKNNSGLPSAYKKNICTPKIKKNYISNSLRS